MTCMSFTWLSFHLNVLLKCAKLVSTSMGRSTRLDFFKLDSILRFPGHALQASPSSQSFTSMMLSWASPKSCWPVCRLDGPGSLYAVMVTYLSNDHWLDFRSTSKKVNSHLSGRNRWMYKIAPIRNRLLCWARTWPHELPLPVQARLADRSFWQKSGWPLKMRCRFHWLTWFRIAYKLRVYFFVVD